MPPRTSGEVNYCQEKFVGEVYNPYEMNVENSPPPGEGELVESILCLLERNFTENVLIIYILFTVLYRYLVSPKIHGR